MRQLVKEISNAIKLASKKNMKPCFRLNLTSDIAWESQKFNGTKIMDIFSDVQFYDYTKSVKRVEKYLNGNFPAISLNIFKKRMQRQRNKKIAFVGSKCCLCVS